MIDEENIERWVKNKIITREQAEKMRADIAVQQSENRSNKFIVALSAVGSVLLGLGLLLLMATYWDTIPNLLKVFILASSTLLTTYLGYVFMYQKRNLPRVGASLIFLGALIFGATIILIAQIYNIPASSHILILLWMLGVLPLVYILKNRLLSGLVAVLFFYWLALFFSPRDLWWFIDALGPLSLVLFVLGCLALLALGGIHYVREDLSRIARMYRLVSLQILMISLFFLSFPFQERYFTNIPLMFSLGVIILAAVTFLLVSVHFFLKNPKKLLAAELPVSVVLLAMMLLFFFYPTALELYAIIFNVILAGFIGILIYSGYNQEDIRLVNIGFFWLFIFIAVKYFDWMWELLPSSVFFIGGGVVLLVAGIFLERKRGNIKKRFVHAP